MEWIVPVPALTPVIVIAEYPLKSLDIALSDSLLELLLLLRSVNEELVTIVSLLVTLLA